MKRTETKSDHHFVINSFSKILRFLRSRSDKSPVRIDYQLTGGRKRMTNLKKSLSQAGYNQEEAYFFQKERELIEKARAERPKLQLIQGGKADAPAATRTEAKSGRKAA